MRYAGQNADMSQLLKFNDMSILSKKIQTVNFDTECAVMYLLYPEKGTFAFGIADTLRCIPLPRIYHIADVLFEYDSIG